MRLLFIAIYCALIYADQQVLKPRHKVAIIGSGAGGSSTAYHLSKNPDIDITVFESSAYIGGRSITLNNLTGRLEDVELGASVFIDKNKILMNAVAEFGLELQKFDIHEKNSSLQSGIGIWDGQNFVYDSGNWWSKIRFYWKYGFQYWKLQKMATRVIDDIFFRNFYNGTFNLNDICRETGLIELTNQTALSYFLDNALSQDFIDEFISSLTRINYSQDIDEIHALGAMVTVAAAMGDVRQVKGGNYQIFEKFIESSGAFLKLNHNVTAITKFDQGYMVKTHAGSEFFDQVVIANPTTANYIKLHVYIIGSNDTLQTTYFNTTTVPSLITTIKGEPNFFSINLIDYKDQYIYKIFTSSKPPFDQFFSNYELIYHQLWDAYPRLTPTDNFANFEIDNGLWFVNLMEPFISTMETECLAGANIASMIISSI